MSTKVLDQFTLLDGSPRCDCSFVRGDSVSVGGRDFKRTVRVPHIDVLAHMPPKVLLFPVALQVVMKFAKPRKLEQSGFCLRDIFCYYDFMQQDMRNVVFVDTACEIVLGSVLTNRRPKVYLQQAFSYSDFGIITVAGLT